MLNFLFQSSETEKDHYITSKILYHSNVMSANPVEEGAINKQTEKELAITMEELYTYAENDIEIKAYVTYELNRDKKDITYKSIVDFCGISADEKEAKNVIQRGKRKLIKKVPQLKYFKDIQEWLRSI